MEVATWFERRGAAGVLVTLALALLLAACGGEQASAPSRGADGASAPRAPAGQPAESAGGPALQEEGAGAPQATAAAGGSTGAEQAEPRLVISTASLGLGVPDVGAAMARVQRVAAQFNGYVLSSAKRQEEGGTYADLKLAIPSARFLDALAALRGVGEQVSAESIEGQDVTEEFVDLGSRNRTLEGTRDSLLALLDRARNVNEVLAVRRELDRVVGDLERVKGRMQYLSQRASLAQISVTLSPIGGGAVAPEAWSPLRTAEEAWAASLRTLQAIATLAISVVVYSWWLLPLLLIAAVVLRQVRRNRRRAVASGGAGGAS